MSDKVLVKQMDQEYKDKNAPSLASNNDSGTTEFKSVQAPVLQLPKGGGAIRGIDEKFSVNPATGAASLTIPIATSPGRQGFGPSLSLAYNTGGGNGLFGLGWGLSTPSITRKTAKGLPRYFDNEESDTFLLSGAEDLVPVLNPDTSRYIDNDSFPDYSIHRYRPRIEGLFARIERWTHKSGEVHWRSISKENILTIYGLTKNARISDPADDQSIRRVFQWLIEKSYDDKGNVICYEYKEEAVTANKHIWEEQRREFPESLGNKHIKRIFYGNKTPRFRENSIDDRLEDIRGDFLFELIFDYGEHGDNLAFTLNNEAQLDAVALDYEGSAEWIPRQDPFSSYAPGYELRTYRLCQRVLMVHHFDELGDSPCVVRSTDFDYKENPVATYLVGATHSGYVRNQDGTYKQRIFPPAEYTYSEAKIDEFSQPLSVESYDNLPYGVDGVNYRWIDLDGEGIPGVLTAQAGTWYYKPNLGNARLGPTREVDPIPSINDLRSGAQLIDLGGDGKLDLVVRQAGLHGYYKRTGNGTWQPFIEIPNIPNINWQDPNQRLIDLSGDGFADILITEHELFVWYPSLGKQGYGPSEAVHKKLDEDEGPAIVFADGTETIHLADMSGDGLSDIVRIRNGEVCYWPNLGYGRFGRKVTMGGMGQLDALDLFDPKHIRLADIDGSGTTDIAYLKSDQVNIYLNQSGNSFFVANPITDLPDYTNETSVDVIDLLGKGTACLVWSCPKDLPEKSLQYVDLMTDGKPHLVRKIKNNLGREVSFQYAASTEFYLEDKENGTPWVTRLSFPVHVVKKITVYDKWRDSRFSSSYSYHHGYFDGLEREFRGFGRVEQTDVESFGHFLEGNSSSPYITDDKTLYQPPAKTISWFHVGAFIDRNHILSHFQHEYFAPETNQFTEHVLPDPDLVDQQFSNKEWPEALRACKGLPLRQEVYELDVDAQDSGEEARVKLFSTTFHNCNIQRLQPHGENRHAVFLVTESEAITYHYELDLSAAQIEPDPRISHTLNLEIDDLGNVIKSVTIAYSRYGQHSDNTLPVGTEALIADVQQERHLSYTENRFTEDDSIDDNITNPHYRLPLPCEVKNHELTGTTPQSGSYYTLEELRTSLVDASVELIDYHEIANRNSHQKRCVEHVRMLYFNSDLQSALDFGQHNHLGLPYETYKLALTQDLLNAVFTPQQITPEIQAQLDDESLSGYLSGTQLVSYFNDLALEQYWIRSGIAGFANDAADHFFLPERYTDPFDQTTALNYDALDLFITSSTDPVGNTSEVTSFNYRVLAPSEMKDINANFTQAHFDIRGLPCAMAMKGKADDADRLDDFNDVLANPTLGELDLFFRNDPFDESKAREWLDEATARHIYSFGEKLENGKLVWGVSPASACSIMREIHKDPNTPMQLGFEFSDGSGTVLVTKNQAEPEVASGPMRWIANGKTILNNKGKPVKQYEPYFTDSHTFAEPLAYGVTPVMYYDSAGRLIRSELPDGSFSRVEFTPWMMRSYDPNDTALDNNNAWYQRMSAGSPVQRRTAQLVAHHANTPSEVHMDCLGREVISVDHNKVPSDAPGFNNIPLLNRPWLDMKNVTFTKLDTEGKPLWIRDARGNLVMQYITPPKPIRAADAPDPAHPEDVSVETVPCYDIAGNQLFQHSMDGGNRWIINDATGQPFYAWDKNERTSEDENGISTFQLEQRCSHTTYDALRRPLQQQLKINDGDWQVVERLVYGESLNNAESKNLNGQLYKHYDPSGLMTNLEIDFKGNLQQVQRRLASDYEAAIIHWPDDSTTIGLESADEIFTQNTEYDALSRMVHQENWHIAGRTPATYTPGYSSRGLLESETLTVNGEVTEAITNLEYDAKGQRNRIEYGNGTTTRYIYDTQTFRLQQLRTTRPNHDNPLPTSPGNLSNSNVLQNLYYTYDAAGNITEIQDDAYEPVFFRNQRVEPRSTYLYDAQYQLIEASGRENYHTSEAPGQFESTPSKISFPVTDKVLRNYGQRYIYDEVGNILEMRHKADAGGWTRHYGYADDSNRLLRTWIGNDTNNAKNYDYDTHGSMLNLNRIPEEYRLRWDVRDMIHTVDLGGGGQAWYSYDSEKQRTRKRIERIGNIVVERLYLGGMERYRRWQANNLVEEIETYHLFVDEQRVLLVENVLQTDNQNLDEGVLYRYQYNNHLGSACLEMDDGARVISYEEYHPYGTTAYHALDRDLKVVAKRYRYTGMEQDEETGLSYRGVRFYIPLGRWINPDPAGFVDGLCLYSFVASNPIRFVDTTGNELTEFQINVMRINEINRANNVVKAASLKEKLAENYFDSTEEAAQVATQAQYELEALGEVGFWESLNPFVWIPNKFREVSAKTRLAQVRHDMIPIEERTGDFSYAPVVSAVAELVAEGAVAAIGGSAFGGGPKGRTVRIVENISDPIRKRVPELSRNAFKKLKDHIANTQKRSDKIVEKVRETGRIPDRVKGRINIRRGHKDIKGSGLDYALDRRHGVDAPFREGKSLFYLTRDEILDILQDPKIIDAPVELLESGAFSRTIDLGDFGHLGIGQLRSGKGQTNYIQILTDAFGNLKTIFPEVAR